MELTKMTSIYSICYNKGNLLNCKPLTQSEQNRQLKYSCNFIRFIIDIFAKMNSLVRELKKYGNLTPEAEAGLNAKIKSLTKQKGDFLLKKGQVNSNVFIIEQGLVRSFYQKGDREINVWFGFENTILGSVMPLFFNRPSIENIQFLEPSTIFYITGNDLNSLYKTYLEMNTIGRRLAEEYCKILEERAFSLQTQNAEQRYNALLKSYPDSIRRISLGHIASYLGVSQETLSRIRKK